ncbi:MAG TPA: alpha/beta hydrolase [Candidatus Limnocylindrales bacterium]|nr:alpha/beta hydrolase [Candidatus Limnocylindrales bacterium]
MKHAVIVHCWNGTPEYCWYPKTKQELEQQNFQVTVPEMPETNLPKLSLWLPTLKEAIGIPNENLYLVGHSIGCMAILRYLEQLNENEKVGGVILVAGFTDDLRSVDPIEDELKNFFESPILWSKLKTKAKKYIAIHSDNDPYVSLKYGYIFKEKLGAELIIKHSMGHFSGPVDNADSITSLPDVTREILKMAK